MSTQLHLTEDIASGFCRCGCGKQTPIAKRTDTARGRIKGQPCPVLDKHQGRRYSLIAGGLFRVCSLCHKQKAIEEFTTQTKGLLGKSTYCIVCNRKRGAEYRKRRREFCVQSVAKIHLRKEYGLSLEQYASMLATQNELCAICKRPQGDKHKGRYRALAVDHCAITGRVRGLLCGICNRGIGALRHDVSILRQAITYLETPTM